MAAPSGDDRRNALKETFDVLLEMSQLLNTGLDAQSLALCVKLCETGANPEALANLIKELRARTAPNVTTWSLRPEHAER
ncbi:mitotic-spindle organizing protein 1 [Dermacentor silvarum]|uniref:mitotic-spindle organizing protein 1 n=1 Tax=Dermacentor silvarum TaxID=543639 RepID=UPI001898D4D3|nr:mitotic-spindle organizing protein 1 [Dermacentor silvarum]XP_049514526.1 mitotic-spindle organizing protein 1 [Dermacentor silvarum]